MVITTGVSRYVPIRPAASQSSACSERSSSSISLPGPSCDFGLGNPFAMPYVTIEVVPPVGGQRLVIVNDTNFGSTGRNPALPDDSDVIVVRVPGLDR
jgi:hypothetical protein